MAQDFESNGARITNSATTIFTADSDAIITKGIIAIARFVPRGRAFVHRIRDNSQKGIRLALS